MLTPLASVTLIGVEQTNPAIPDDDTPGDLAAEEVGLVFRATNGNFKYAIPFQHIDKCEHVQRPNPAKKAISSLVFMAGLIFGCGLAAVMTIPVNGQALQIVGVLIFGAGYAYSFYFSTGTDQTVTINAWDENFGMDTTTIFSLGDSYNAREEARKLVKTIWQYRGAQRQITKQDTRIHRQ